MKAVQGNWFEVLSTVRRLNDTTFSNQPHYHDDDDDAAAATLLGSIDVLMGFMLDLMIDYDMVLVNYLDLLIL